MQNLTNCTHKLIELVEAGTFALDKKTFTVLHGIVARRKLWNGEISVGKVRSSTTLPMLV